MSIPYMSKFVLTIVCLLAMPLLAHAQVSVFSFNQDGGSFYVHAGTYGSNIQDQYDALKLNAVRGNDAQNVDTLGRQPIAYPKPSASLLNFGIGGYGIRSSIIFGGEINFYVGSNKSAGLTDTTLNPTAADRNYTVKSTSLGTDIMATLGIVALRAGGLVAYGRPWLRWYVYPYFR
jgi:hypothetical protein